MQNVGSEIAAYRQSNSVVSVPEQRTSERNIGPLPRPYTELVVVVVTVTPAKVLVTAQYIMIVKYQYRMLL